MTNLALILFALYWFCAIHWVHCRLFYCIHNCFADSDEADKAQDCSQTMCMTSIAKNPLFAYCITPYGTRNDNTSHDNHDPKIWGWMKEEKDDLLPSSTYGFAAVKNCESCWKSQLNLNYAIFFFPAGFRLLSFLEIFQCLFGYSRSICSGPISSPLRGDAHHLSLTF